MSWTIAMPIDEIRQKRPSLLRHGKKQIAVFEVSGRVFATDNRCPHEGYPLKEGAVDENCVLTCNWHNWKFDLSSGKNLLGMDSVRTYPTKLENGQVWVDLTDPSQSVVEQEILRGLEAAFEDRDYGRVSRQIAKLHFHGIDPLVSIRHAIEWSHELFELGMTHAYAATADWIGLYDTLEAKTEEQLTCLVEAVDHIAHDGLRQAEYPFVLDEQPYSEDGFVAAIEHENEPEAIRHLNGALASGIEWHELERGLTRAALAHFNDFGHSLIYVSKVAALAERLGPEVLPFLTRNLVRSIIYATREDLLPEFRKLDEHIELYPEGPGPDTADDLSGDTPYGKSVNETLVWVVSRAQRASSRCLYETLLTTCARNLLHYDTKFDDTVRQPVGKNASWLFGSHALTFANAARKQCEKFPELWKIALLQMGCFSGRLRPFVDLEMDEGPWLVKDESAFLESCQASVLDHGLDPPIYSSHLLKTFWALREELQSETLERKYVLAGLNRFFHSRLRQKHPLRTMHQSLELVSKDF